jgi:hypothetical protein
LHDSYNKQEFENEIFHDTDVIDSFRDFDTKFKEENNIDINEEFEISNQAVKKQARIFKSVLKLDKNFHPSPGITTSHQIAYSYL